MSTIVADNSSCEVLCMVSFGPQHLPTSVGVYVDDVDGGVFPLPASPGRNNYSFTLPPLPAGPHAVLLSLLVQGSEAASHSVSFTVAKKIESPPHVNETAAPAPVQPDRGHPLPPAAKPPDPPVAAVRIASPPPCAILDSDSFDIEIEASFPAPAPARAGAAGDAARLLLIVNGHEQPLEPAPRCCRFGAPES